MKKYFCVFSFYLFYLIVFYPAFVIGLDKSKVKIKSRINKKEIHIGDIIDYQLNVSIPQNTYLKMTPISENFNDFIVRDYKFLAPKTNKSRIENIIKYQLTIYQVGDFEIPSITINIISNQKEYFFKTKQMNITVNSLLEKIEGSSNQNAIFDIEKNFQTKANIPQRYYLYIFLSIVTFILIISFIILIVVRYYKVKISSYFYRTKTVINKWQKSIQNKPNYFIQREFFYQFSFLVKTFVGSHINVNLTHLTTKEVEKKIIDYIAFDQENRNYFLSILKRCDESKYPRNINEINAEEQLKILNDFKFIIDRIEKVKKNK